MQGLTERTIQHSTPSGSASAPPRPGRTPRRLPALLFLAGVAFFVLKSDVYLAPHRVQMSALALQSLDGSSVPSQLLQGKPIILNFWAPWCPPCRLELPWLQALQRQHPEVAIIGIEDDPDEFDQARALLAQDQISYLQLRPNDAVRRKFGEVSGLPTTLYISASGKVVHTVSGAVPEKVMANYLHDAIATH